MNILRLFSSTNGRIGRATFWKGAAVLIVAMVILSGIAIALGFSTSQNFTQTIAFEGQSTQEVVGTQWQVHPWASFLIWLVFSVPFSVMAVKRRHDRNFAGWDIYAFVSLQLIMAALRVFGVGEGIVAAMSPVVFVWSICLLVLLGFLRGTSGANSYGPDPLVASTTDLGLSPP